MKPHTTRRSTIVTLLKNNRRLWYMLTNLSSGSRLWIRPVEVVFNKLYELDAVELQNCLQNL